MGRHASHRYWTEMPPFQIVSTDATGWLTVTFILRTRYGTAFVVVPVGTYDRRGHELYTKLVSLTTIDARLLPAMP